VYGQWYSIPVVGSPLGVVAGDSDPAHLQRLPALFLQLGGSGLHPCERARLQQLSNAMADLPTGVEGQGVVGLDPSPQELVNIVGLDTALQWPGVDAPLFAGLVAVIGNPKVLRDISFIPRADWITYLSNITVGDGAVPILPTEVARLWSFRRVCRIRCGLTPGDNPEPNLGLLPAPAWPGQGAAAFASPAGPIKLDQILDPSLSAVLRPLDTVRIRTAYDQYIAKFGANPEEGIDPTPDQLSAVAHVLADDRIPYANFAYFGPHGKRLLEKLTFLSFVLLPSGQWQRQELEGPPSYDTWWSCWRVYRACMLLLEAADAENLDNYAEHIRSL
jgi:hypothetical protein